MKVVCSTGFGGNACWAMRLLTQSWLYRTLEALEKENWWIHYSQCFSFSLSFHIWAVHLKHLQGAAPCIPWQNLKILYTWLHDSNVPGTRSVRNLLLLQNYTGLEGRCSIQTLALSYSVFQLAAVPGFALILWRCPEASSTSTARSLHDSCSWAICSALLLL